MSRALLELTAQPPATPSSPAAEGATEGAAPHRLPRGWLWAATAVALAAAPALLGSFGGAYRLLPPESLRRSPAAPETAPTADDGARRLRALAPRGIYLVVDSYHNRLRVYDGGRLLREAVCSTGSGSVLQDPRSGRRWVFDTPLGERRVVRKVRDPIWVKPDWAFIEEGQEPPDDPRERLDDLSLGAYGLYLGDGYIIHGTLFQTLLGLRITHGCIRLGDEDLEYVYHHVPVGARVLLY